MAQGKVQMINKLIAGLVALVENAETILLSVTAPDIFLRNTAGLPDRRLKTKRLDKRRPANKLRPGWNKLVLKVSRYFSI